MIRYALGLRNIARLIRARARSVWDRCRDDFATGRRAQRPNLVEFVP